MCRTPAWAQWVPLCTGTLHTKATMALSLTRTQSSESQCPRGPRFCSTQAKQLGDSLSGLGAPLTEASAHDGQSPLWSRKERGL